MALGEPRGARGLRVLVTGGAGYIGSFVVRHLLDAGHAVTVYDNLYAGNRWAAQEAELVVADMGDRERLDAVLAAPASTRSSTAPPTSGSASRSATRRSTTGTTPRVAVALSTAAPGTGSAMSSSPRPPPSTASPTCR